MHYSYSLNIFSKNATINKDGLVEYCCTGLCVDLLQILSSKMNFDYEMYEVPDREWGIKDEVRKVFGCAYILFVSVNISIRINQCDVVLTGKK